MADISKVTLVVARKAPPNKTETSTAGTSSTQNERPINTKKLAVCVKASANQENSPLLGLPAELRNRIYIMVLQAETILISARFVTAFDVATRLRAHCNPTPPVHVQTQDWNDKDRPAFLPIVCRQLYAETHGLLYGLNNFSFTDESAMRFWISCRSSRQRQLIRSMKIPATLTDYYRGRRELRLTKIFPNLHTIYIDVWRIVEKQISFTDTTLEEAVRMVTLEQSLAQQREGQSVKVIPTKYQYHTSFVGVEITEA